MSETNSSITEDGLRYKSKDAGSPFVRSDGFSGSTRSCFFCGQHRPRNLLKTKTLLGKSHLVCDPSCKEFKKS